MKIKQALAKINNLSPAAKASFWFVVSNLALKGISFITTPIFTRVMEVADYGTASVFHSWEGVISIFATLSLAGGVYNVAMTKYEKDVPAYTSSMMTLTALATVLTYAVCIGINLVFPQLFDLGNIYLVFMAVQTFLNAASTFWLMQKRFTYSYKPVILYTFANALLSPTLALVAIYLVPENKAMAKIVGSAIPAITIGIVLLVQAIAKGKKLFVREYWKFALRFNIPLLPHYLSGILMNASDKLMISSMVGKAEAGIYSVAHSITGLVSIVTGAINNSLIPYTLQSIKKQAFQGLRNTITGCTLLVSVFCIGVVMFAKEGILIFATEEYLSAVNFIVPLSLAVVLELVSGIVGNIVFYYEKTAFMSRATIITAVLNIVLNYLGIRYFGFAAAGYTTAICALIKLALYYSGARKYEANIRQIIDIKLLAAIFVAFLAFAVYGALFADHFVLRLGLVLALLIVLLIKRKAIFQLIGKLKTKGV